MPLTPEQLQYVVGGAGLFLAAAVGRHVVAAVGRIPDATWFARVEKHMEQAQDHRAMLNDHRVRLEIVSVDLQKGRDRMNRIDEHLEATDNSVAAHETRISVLEAKRV